MARPERFELPTLWFEVRRFLSYLVLTFCGRQLAKLEDLTTYNFIYSAVDEKPEDSFKSLKKMVGASGFEPPTSWSRTRIPPFPLLSTVGFLVFPSTTYESIVESGGTLNRAIVGTVLRTVPAPASKTVPAPAAKPFVNISMTFDRGFARCPAIQSSVLQAARREPGQRVGVRHCKLGASRPAREASPGDGREAGNEHTA